MLNIRGMSMVEDFLTGVNRFGRGPDSLTHDMHVRHRRDELAAVLEEAGERVFQRAGLPAEGVSFSSNGHNFAARPG